jgi:DNA-binding transcriptional regulator YdaS (Cro superfamily)
MDPLQKAADAVGGLSRLAEMVGVSSSTPFMWRTRKRIPAEYCAAIESATSGAVTRRDLRPDDWADIWPELVEKSHA